MIREIKATDWYINLWISFVPFSLVLLNVDWRCFAGFLLGTVGSQLSLLMMIKDVRHFRSQGVKTLRVGFLKRYTLSAIVLGISSSLSIWGVLSAFFGLELMRLTLTTFWRSGEF